MPGMMSIGGIASGLQTNEIIAKIMEYARRPQTKLQTAKDTAQSRLTAWQDLNTRALALKIKAEAIADAADFRSTSATSSDETILTATGSTSATPGTYYVKVTQRAQAHQLASISDLENPTYTSVNDSVGTGTVSFELKNGTVFDVTLDSNNNTLAGLRDAINSAGKGVKASIINAGTSTSPDYRLLVTSSDTGTQNEITVLDTSGLSGGKAPNFDLLSPVQKALDARLEIGGGAGTTPISIIKSSNTIADVIPGVTLNIADADATKTIRVDVRRDTSAIKTAIQDFTAQFNSLADAIKNLTMYDPDSGDTGLLMGDFQIQSVQMDLMSVVTGSVIGLTSKYSAISGIGVTLDAAGHLGINDAELTKALESNLDDVIKVFSSSVTSGSSHVSYIADSPDTRPSGISGWQVDVTQSARRAQVTAGAAMVGNLTVDETISVNGTSIELTAGMGLDQVIARINSYSTDTGVMAIKTGEDGTGTGNHLTFRRVQYGSAHVVSVSSNKSRAAGVTTGLGSTAVSSTNPAGEDGLGQGMEGLDVKGTINGEEATGRGQVLSISSASSTNLAKGLSLMITATEPMSTTVRFTKGVGASLRDLLNNMTSAGGTMRTAQDGLNSHISDLTESIASMEARLADQEARIYSQFNAMEAQLAKLQQQGNYLAAQLGAWNNSKK